MDGRVWKSLFDSSVKGIGMNKDANAVFAALLASIAITTTTKGEIFGFVGDTTYEGGWYAFEDEFDVEMTPIIHGGAPFESVISIDVPEFGGSLDFDSDHSLRHIGSGWGIWGHGYAGEVFYNNGHFEMGYYLNMQGVQAFDAYIIPNWGYPEYHVTAYGSGGGQASIEFDAVWSFGATHFGFYSADEDLVRIEIEGNDWAIGEWRVGVPAPGVLALFAVAGLRGRSPRRECQV